MIKLFEKLNRFLDNKADHFSSRYDETNPVYMQFSLMFVGLLIALFYFAATYFPLLYIFGVVLIIVRLILQSISTPKLIGNAKARTLKLLAPEVCDILLLLGIIIADFDFAVIGLLVMGIYWFVAYLRVLERSKNISITYLLGKNEHLFILLLISILQMIFQWFHWPIDWIYLYLVWLVLSGLATIYLAYHNLVAHN